MRTLMIGWWLMRRRLLDAAGIALFALVLGVISWRCWTRLRPEVEPQHPTRTAMADFQDVVYYPSRAAWAGVNPYDARSPDQGGKYMAQFRAGNTFPMYAPLVFVLSWPLAALPLLPAEIAYWLLNVGLLLVYAYVLVRESGMATRPGTIAACAAILLLSRPGHANFYFGAIALPMILATLGAWWLADRQPWISALCLVLAIIKPTFGGPLFVLLVLKGSYRAAFTGIAIAALVNLAIVATLLPHELFSTNWLDQLSHNQAVIDADSAVDPLLSVSRIDFPAVVERLYGWRLPGLARYALTLLVLAVAGWHLRLLSGSSSRDMLLSTGFACLTIAICIYHNIYDALLIAVPAALVARELTMEKRTRPYLLTWPLAICFAIPALNYFSSKQFWAALIQWQPSLMSAASSGGLWTLVGAVNGLCLTGAWCLLLVMIRRRIERPAPIDGERGT
jgi:hypothetical protein